MTCIKQVIDAFELLDDPNINGSQVKAFFKTFDIETIETTTITGAKGKRVLSVVS